MAMELLREETAEEKTREVCDLSIEELERLDRTIRALLARRNAIS